jgi:hypothetical protein
MPCNSEHRAGARGDKHADPQARARMHGQPAGERARDHDAFDARFSTPARHRSTPTCRRSTAWRADTADQKSALIAASVTSESGSASQRRRRGIASSANATITSAM